MNCLTCHEKLFTIVDDDYELFNWPDDGQDLNIYVDEKNILVREAYFIEGGGDGLSNYFMVQGEYNQRWCRKCDMLYVACCNKPCILSSVCSLSKSGSCIEWYTFDPANKEFIKHELADWPYEYLDEESNLNIESLRIIDQKDPILNNLCLTGPDGGCPVSYKCVECDEEYWFHDK